MSHNSTLQEMTDYQSVRRLLFYEKGAMSFQAREIEPEVLEKILKASTSCAWLGKWRLVSVSKRENIVKVVESWQIGLRKIGQNRDVEFVERWKKAPLIIAFCQPRKFDQFHFVVGDLARMYSVQEIGTAVRSVELSALAYGIGLHGIMGILVPEVVEHINEVLGIPRDYEIVYFGLMGYPDEEVVQKFPSVSEFCYAEKWGIPVDLDPT
jgi:nitroreductase